MDRARCQTCNAGLPAGSPWCPLCYTPVAAEQPSPADAVSLARSVGPPVLTGVIGSGPGTGGIASAPWGDPEQTAAPVPGRHGAGPAAAFWPCTACGGSVPIADEVCPQCGAGFLFELGDPLAMSWEMPLVGRLDVRDRGKLVAVGGGLGLLLAMLLIGLSYAFGAL